MNLSRFQIDWKNIVAIALDLSITVSAWKLLVVIQLLSGSILVSLTCGLLFWVTGVAIHRVARGQTTRVRLLSLLLVYSFKVVPAAAYAIEIHCEEMESQMKSTSQSPDMSKAAQAKKEQRAKQYECQSLRMAKCLLWLLTARPASMFVALFLTWLGIISSDILSLFLDFLREKLD